MTFIIKEVPDGTDLIKEHVNIDHQFESIDGNVVTIGYIALNPNGDVSKFLVAAEKYLDELIGVLLRVADAPNVTKRDELIDSVRLRMHAYKYMEGTHE